MTQILDIIPKITRDEKEIIERKVIPRLRMMYSHLEVPLENIENLITKTLNIIKEGGAIENIERTLRRELEEGKVFNHFNEKMDVRALMWYQKIRDYIPEGRLLDLGGGDGRTAKRIVDESKKVGKNIEASVADIVNYPDRVRDLPYFRLTTNPNERSQLKTYLDFPDNAFDSVFVGTVYHHVGKRLDDSLKLMDESIRLAKKRLVIIESIYQSEEEKLYTTWIDWFYNRVLHYSDNLGEKVNVPLNFKRPFEWSDEVKKRGMRECLTKDLGTFQILNPEHHWLYVFEKR